MRVLWMATELDLTFVHHAWEYDDPRLKEADFLRLNPAGTIPTIEDDGFALSESLAINVYLARTYGGSTGLFPNDPRAQAEVLRWSLWAQGHIEPWVQKDLSLRDVLATLADQTRPVVYHALSILNDVLGRGDWLVGDHFSVADLNIAGVLSPSRSRELDLADYAHVRRWLDRCYARPAALAARKKYASG